MPARFTPSHALRLVAEHAIPRCSRPRGRLSDSPLTLRRDAPGTNRSRYPTHHLDRCSRLLVKGCELHGPKRLHPTIELLRALERGGRHHCRPLPLVVPVRSSTEKRSRTRPRAVTQPQPSPYAVAASTTRRNLQTTESTSTPSERPDLARNEPFQRIPLAPKGREPRSTRRTEPVPRGHLPRGPMVDQSACALWRRGRLDSIERSLVTAR